MPKLTQLEPGIVVKQPQQGPAINLPLQSIGIQNLSPGALNAIHPVGATMSAFLTETQFQNQMGTGWILADGRSVAGSTYAALTGNVNVPDARGLVLRASNDGGSSAGARSDGKGDPAGTQAVGTYEGDTTAVNGLHDTGHAHGISPGAAEYYPINDAQGSATSSPVPRAQGGDITSTQTAYAELAGDAETRVKAIIVNHFIRIN